MNPDLHKPRVSPGASPQLQAFLREHTPRTPVSQPVRRWGKVLHTFGWATTQYPDCVVVHDFGGPVVVGGTRVPSGTPAIPADAHYASRLVQLIGLIPGSRESMGVLDPDGYVNPSALQKAGFTHLGGGGQREVFRLVPGWVAKVSTDPSGSANRQEQWNGQDIAQHGCDTLLAPIRELALEDQILVMPEAIPFDVSGHYPNYRPPRKYQKEYNQARRDLDACGWLGHDAKFAFNWGVLNGRVVLLDYGTLFDE